MRRIPEKTEQGRTAARHERGLRTEPFELTQGGGEFRMLPENSWFEIIDQRKSIKRRTGNTPGDTLKLSQDTGLSS